MTYQLAFQVIYNGQVVSDGMTFNINQQPGTLAPVIIRMTNVGNQPIDWAFVTSTVPPTLPPAQPYFPSNALISNLLQGQSPQITQLNPGQSIEGAYSFVVPVNGSSIVVTLRGQGEIIGQSLLFFDRNINLVLIGQGIIPTPPPPPVPGPPPSSQGQSGLGIVALGAGAVLLGIAFLGRKDNG